MPAPHLHTFYQHAFLQRARRRYALILIPTEAQRLDQNYDERRGPITAAWLIRHMAGESNLTAPVAGDCRTLLPSLDIDAGGIVAIHAPICEATQRGLWSFGQYCPRISLDNQDTLGALAELQRTDRENPTTTSRKPNSWDEPCAPTHDRCALIESLGSCRSSTRIICSSPTG